MERTSEHQVLPPVERETLAKEKIEALLKEHNLGENVDLIYRIICECNKAGGETIDLCVDRIVQEFVDHKKQAIQDEEDDVINQLQGIYTKE